MSTVYGKYNTTPATPDSDHLALWPDQDTEIWKWMKYDGIVKNLGEIDVATINISSNVTLSNKTIHFIDTSGARLLTLPAPSTNLYMTLKDISGLAATNTVTLVRPGSEEIETVAADFVLNTNLFSVTIVSDGTNYFLI